MIQYFLRQHILLKVSKVILYIVWATNFACINWQTINTSNSKNISKPLVTGVKKVSFLIPLQIKDTCNPEIELEFDFAYIKKLSNELNKRGIDSSFIGIAKNFKIADIREGTYLKQEVSGGYVERHSQSYIHREYVTKIECFFISQEQYRSGELKMPQKLGEVTRNGNISESYGKFKLPNAWITLDDKVFVKLKDMGAIPVIGKDFLLKSIDITQNESETTLWLNVKTSNFNDHDGKGWSLAYSYLFLFTLGLFPWYVSHSTEISMAKENTTEYIIARETTTRELHWLPLILTFGLLKDDSLGYSESTTTIQGVLDDIGLK